MSMRLLDNHNPTFAASIVLLGVVAVLAVEVRQLKADMREYDKPSYQEYLAREFVQVGGELQRIRWAKVCK